jgi:hypothetical protein
MRSGSYCARSAAQQSSEDLIEEPITTNRHSMASSVNASSRLPRATASALQSLSRSAARLVCHLSATNWLIVKGRVGNRLTYLANTGSAGSSATGTGGEELELRMVEWCDLDQEKLIGLLQSE